MSPTTAIVLGVLLVGGTYLVLRRQEDDSGPAGNQVCGELGQADAKLGLACSLAPVVLGGLKGLGEAGAEAAGGITHTTSSIGAKATAPLRDVLDAVMKQLGGCGPECVRRICTGLHNDGRYAGFFTRAVAGEQLRQYCSSIGLGW